MSKTIGSIAKSIGSGITPLRSNAAYWNSCDYPWLKTEQLSQYKIYTANEYISQTALEETTIKLWPAKTVTVAMYGEGKTRGNAAIIMSQMTTNQACCNIIVNEEEADYRFLYYWLKNNYEQLRNLAAGVRKNLNSDDIKGFPFPEMDVSIQKRIADVLSVIDDKIENNDKTICELESMAKTLYDYWFVQFDFPDANGKPYRTSGGEMVWNEQLKREIPKGWVVRPLSYYLYCNRNTIKRNEWNSYINYLDTGSLTSNRIDELQRYETIEEAPSRAQRVVCPNDILYSTVRPNQCHYGLIKSPSPNLVASSGFACLASKFSAEYNDLFYLFLTSERIVNRLTSIAASSVSAYPSINPSDILEQFIALPEELDSIHGLSNRLCDLLSAVTHYQTESKELTRLRDWLLPMLMNGQATVATAESAPKLQVLKPENPARDPRFDRWLQTQGVAARGTVDEQTLHDIFDAMDDDDKQ